MSLTSQIQEYNAQWLSQFDGEATRLCLIFGATLIDIHHVGSTAVPGLAAKPEIGILIVVGEQEKEVDWSAALAGIGYKRGGNLSAGHQFYRRNVAGIRTHKLHACVAGHSEIVRMLEFINLLRRNKRLRQEYESLKLNLARSETIGMIEYLEKKKPFIEATLKLSSGS